MVTAQTKYGSLNEHALQDEWRRHVLWGASHYFAMLANAVVRSRKSGAEPPHSKTLSRERKRLNDRQVLECGGSAPLLWNVQESEIRPAIQRKISLRGERGPWKG